MIRCCMCSGQPIITIEDSPFKTRKIDMVIEGDQVIIKEYKDGVLDVYHRRKIVYCPECGRKL